jgi:HPt (histidine-containing phosphotransfer) domain-containing protein
MDGYVSKPIHAQDLFDEIDRCYGQRQSPATLEILPQVAPAPIRIDPAASDAIPSPNGDEDQLAIDWEAALHHTAGDRTLMRTMIDVFLAESPKMLDEVRAAIAARDAARLRRAGHSLKGSCGYFAAQRACCAALAIETLGQNGSLDKADSAVEELARELQRLNPVLAEFQS